MFIQHLPIARHYSTWDAAGVKLDKARSVLEGLRLQRRKRGSEQVDKTCVSSGDMSYRAKQSKEAAYSIDGKGCSSL